VTHQRRRQSFVQRDSPGLDASVVAKGDDRVRFDGKEQVLAENRLE
jgi:hypothetical protein